MAIGKMYGNWMAHRMLLIPLFGWRAPRPALGRIVRIRTIFGYSTPTRAL